MNGMVATFVGPNIPLELRVVQWPALQESELLIEIELAAICGSDLHTFYGRRPEVAPSVLGHEGMGVVLASNRDGIQVGERVTWSLVDSCGHCPMCTDFDLPQKCDHLWKYGHGGNSLDGTYATHIRVRAGTAVYKLPDGLDPRLAATANCALATAMEGVRGLEKPGHAVVLGAGMVGLFAAFLLAEGGYGVCLIDGDASRLRVAKDLKIECALHPSEVSTAFRRVPLVIEAAGSATLLHSAYPALAPGGELRILGLVHPDSDLKLTAEDLVRRCWHISGSHNYRPLSLRLALEAALRFQSTVDVDSLFSPAFPLAEVQSALETASTRAHLRVLVAPQMPARESAAVTNQQH